MGSTPVGEMRVIRRWSYREMGVRQWYVCGAVLYVGLLTPAFCFQDVVSQSEVTEQVRQPFDGMFGA